ncbi:MAG: translation initiation factor IF-2 [Vicinamibacterales bacterium]
MATVRIYKVAELLGSTSQEILALLKREHGIELKSASSTLEEVVARSFVERTARARNIALPAGDIFAEGAHPPAAAAKAGAGKKAPALRKPEPPKAPAAPTLGPPRLVKTVKPAHPVVEGDAAPEHAAAPAAPPAYEPESAVAPEPVAVVQAEPEAATPEPVAAAPEAVSAPATPAAPAAAAPAAPPAPSRVVPSTLRLRVEEPGRTPAPARPMAPAKRPPAQTAPRMVQAPVPGAPPPRPTPRPGMPGQRPPYGGPPRPTTPGMLGGPRPLPAQPVRPAGARPGMPGQRPMYPPRPAFGHRPGGGRPAGAKRERPSAPAQTMVAPPPPVTRSITLAEGMTVKDLADKLEVRVKDVLAKLLMKRMMMTINSPLDTETARDIAREFGADVEMRSFEEEMLDAEVEESKPEDMVERAPVVTVMGHVDHGKTSLLDAIREARVAEREAGGITQHIGAYHVDVNNRKVVFLDTPGHEAFTLMRARGAKVTDVVVLVVAADDGVMPQTREAIDHAKAANVPMVVAINKIDKNNANPDNVKRELSELGLTPEDWGGSTVMVPVSAKKKQNLDQLLEMILLSSDILELKANPNRPASGAVLESKLDRGRGPVATVLVQDGTLRVGDNFIAGPVVGRVRALIDDRGRQVKAAGPATPVEVLGLTTLPSPGDTFQSVADAAKARQIATFRQEQAKARALGAKGSRLTLESLQEQLAEGGMKELPLIVKADVQGSSEVLADTLAKLSDDKVKIRIIHSGVGAINESDVLLATASKAVIIGFNVKPDKNAAEVAEREEVDIRHHTVIYHVTDEIKLAMAGLLDPTFKEVRLGVAQVRDIFKVPKAGTIAGCMVTEGVIRRGGDAQVRLLRNGQLVHEGKIGGLRRFKDDVSEVKSGFECGISLEKFNDVQIGDVIEVVAREKVTAPAAAR